jgi:uncharacterized membrane protein
MPFGAQLRGRQPWRAALPGMVATVGGVALWALVLWGHPLVIGLPALQFG